METLFPSLATVSCSAGTHFISDLCYFVCTVPEKGFGGVGRQVKVSRARGNDAGQLSPVICTFHFEEEWHNVRRRMAATAQMLPCVCLDGPWTPGKRAVL